MPRVSLPLEISPEARQNPHWALVERVAASRGFHSSHRVREFFFYVCDCALRGVPEEATEQQIGIHVFRRPPGYNSSEDSIVRTHARSLRQKLTEYFSSEGANEEIVITIPKGHYLPVFEPREPRELKEQTGNVPPAMSPPAPEEVAEEAAASPARHRFLWLAGLLAVLLLAIGGWFAWTHAQSHPGPVKQFWAPFLANKSSLVIYSNALFSGNSKDGLKYADPMTMQQPLPPNYVDDYTGIGELTSVYDLAHLFDRYHSQFVLKRSLLVTWDQAQNSNLIFIGSVAENPSLRDIPNTREFSLMSNGTESGIINHHPLPGEPKIYERPEYPLTRDYAILALLPGLQPGYQTLIFSGLTTYGTQAAVEFACHRDTLQQLLSKVRGKNGQIRPFEAVLETSIVGGVPVETHLVTVHIR
ncbi:MULTISPECIES: hypothetical protein [Acidobacterium]|uniref:Conserved domain protein n=1 Tax=Acidobacterium capsulatum (strain ATCC 51196 / DSM 11244 / BCRC 80197 / JCM 7670 / NBRC 15755 / NCIMB 13165 / 161) TaxID=240015 RepID=C1F6T6_ACIC5|nr:MULTISPECIES: hypothetical protein [Acidobacterium]ACO31884.1 conserved domain protein [Acidobacterium capsulatum ATCC 51196]HCT60976.1 hypothetical protein [Acidobacterium sp.]